MSDIKQFEEWLEEKAMNDKTIKVKTNPWRNIAMRMEEQACSSLFDSDKEFVGEDDWDDLMSLATPPDSEFDFVTSIPPEPWQGNPLTANLIVLTLNPGYVEKQNHVIADRIQKIPKINKTIANFKAATLRLESDGFLPKEEIDNNNNLSAADYINIIGDWYWYKRFSHLLYDIQTNENDFFKQVAIVQYIPYSSISYRDKQYKNISSSQYSQYLIRYILQQRRNIVVLVLRAASKWEKCLENGNSKDKWHPSNKVIYNKNRSQAISENNLSKENYSVVVNAIKL